MGYLLFSHRPKGSHETSHTSQSAAIVMDCFPQPDGKAPLQKTTLTFVTGHGESELLLLLPNKEFHLSPSAFMVLEGMLHATGGGK